MSGGESSDGRTARRTSIGASSRNKRLDGGGVVQRHVLYLGEINSSQAEVWRKAIEVFDADAGSSSTLALFLEDRCEVAVEDASVVRLRISEMRLHRPRQWGLLVGGPVVARAATRPVLGGAPAREPEANALGPGLVSAGRLPTDRTRQRWRLHREWFGKSAMADLLGSDFGLAEAHKLYACHGLLLAHKDALFSHLTERWRDLFNANFDVLLYDLTSTYFEVNASDLPEGFKRRHGRDKRPDCPQPGDRSGRHARGPAAGFHEVLPGNGGQQDAADVSEQDRKKQYGKARRVWVMDRGVPTEAVLAEMRASDPPVQYLVGTPKGRLNRLEKHLIEKPWQKARAGVEVKLLAQDDELYVCPERRSRRQGTRCGGGS